MKEFVIRIPKELHKKLKHLSVELDKSMNNLVVEKIRELLESKTKCEK